MPTYSMKITIKAGLLTCKTDYAFCEYFRDGTPQDPYLRICKLFDDLEGHSQYLEKTIDGNWMRCPECLESFKMEGK
ncbi:hypothetical protein [Ferrovum sp.]|uniref:hypothetical protein n=1 Tax=Ferrovum sp. TaxID=2609467 RepID=UPI00263088E6|nr:hypothetical protein [Ferrovum sp.]